MDRLPWLLLAVFGFIILLVGGAWSLIRLAMAAFGETIFWQTPGMIAVAVSAIGIVVTIIGWVKLNAPDDSPEGMGA